MMTRRLLFLLATICWLYAPVQAQTQDGTELTGRVLVVEDSSALPGATITIKGTTKGTVSDINGDFRLKVPSGSVVLIVRYIGLKDYEITWSPTRSQPLTIWMEEDERQDVGPIIIQCCYHGYFQASLTSGINYTPYGVELIYRPSNLNIPRFRGEYRRSFDQNQVIKGEADFLFRSYKSTFSKLITKIALSYTNIQLSESTLGFISYQADLGLGHIIKKQPFTMSIGAGYASYENIDFQRKELIGFNLGSSKYIQSLKLNLKAKAVYWQDFWQFEGEISKSIKNVQLGFVTNHFRGYREYSLKLGYQFSL